MRFALVSAQAWLRRRKRRAPECGALRRQRRFESDSVISAVVEENGVHRLLPRAFPSPVVLNIVGGATLRWR